MFNIINKNYLSGKFGIFANNSGFNNTSATKAAAKINANNATNSCALANPFFVKSCVEPKAHLKIKTI